MSIANRYIQVGTSPANNIYTEYGIYITKVEGLNQLPPTKKKWSRDWADEQGEDTYLLDIIRFQNKHIKITFRIDEPMTTDVKTKISNFRDYLFSGGDLSYFDTYRNNGFRGYYDKEKVNEEKYRINDSHIEFEINFVAPNGICFGFDNTENTSINISVLNGYCDLYFSNGEQFFNIDADFNKITNGGFVIVCPSVYNGVLVTSGDGFLFGSQYSGTDYLFGVQYSGTDYLFGI